MELQKFIVYENDRLDLKLICTKKIWISLTGSSGKRYNPVLLHQEIVALMRQLHKHTLHKNDWLEPRITGVYLKFVYHIKIVHNPSKRKKWLFPKLFHFADKPNPDFPNQGEALGKAGHF